MNEARSFKNMFPATLPLKVVELNDAALMSVTSVPPLIRLLPARFSVTSTNTSALMALRPGVPLTVVSARVRSAA